MRSFIMVQVLLIAAICPFARSEILNVPDDFETIQAGIDEAEDGDTVLVEPGEYVENINFGGRAITVASLLLVGGGEASIDSTIIDGNQQSSVVRFDQGEDSSSVLMGFTLINGTGSRDLSGDICGGGIHCLNSSPTLSYLKICRNEARFGGGMFFQSSSPHVFQVVVSENQSYNGGGIYCSREGTEPLIEHVLIFGNTSSENGYRGGGFISYATAHPILRNVTIADNDLYGLQLPAGNATLTNVIVWNNPINGWSGEGAHPRLTIFYSDIQGGQNEISGCDVTWGEGNIDEDPLFADPDNGDYHLADDSPCIDAGDPDGELDPDGSRADMGAFPWSPYFCAFFGGRVLDSETERPIAGARILANNEVGCFIQAESDSLGIWGCCFGAILFDSSSFFQFDITAVGYLEGSAEVEVFIGDSIWIESRLDHGEFLSNPDNLAVEVDSGSIAQVTITIRNDGNGQLTWQAEALTRGEAGAEPWTLRQSIPVGEITGNDRITGVAFDGESYYCAGRGDADQNLIYRLDRDGALLDSFPQPGHSHHGFRDLEWDGELIWGSGEDTIYAINRDGEVAHCWCGQINPIHNIAIDPAGGILWLSTITSRIFAYDCAGNYLDRSIDRQGLRIYGLAWFANDPDSACLYAINNPGGELPPQINKFNPLTGEMRLVHSFAQDSSADLRGAFICRNFDGFQNWVLMTVADISPDDGGDQIQVWQLQPNTEWLAVDPDSGEVPAGEELQVTVNLCTAAEDGDWVFALGEYDGEIVFAHDGFGGEVILPVHLTVVEPSAATPGGRVEMPASFGIVGIYPNPFNSRATLRFEIPTAANVRLTVHDLNGRLVEELVNSRFSAGSHTAVWDGTGLAAGVYLLRLESGSKARVTKGVIIK